ncbi:MAG: SDR family oxidoreductase [Chloroflexi bacterium]|nr:SDR family oxidoreductase [Chloroflexota bacterium]
MTTQPSTILLAKLLDLSGKSAIVTGGAMGIGYGIAQRLCQAGAAVVMADVKLPDAEAAAARLRQAGHKAAAVHCDVSQETGVVRAVQAAVREFGGLDILVNNAGIFPFMPALHMEAALWDKVHAVNLKGVFLCSREAAKQMVSQGRGGRIINIASVDAFHPSGVGLAHYDASKGGVVMFTKSLALELAPHGILVNGIAPGSIVTKGAQAATAGLAPDAQQAVAAAFLQRIPLRRMGTPDDIATAALFLASDMARYMTGDTLVVDGGYLLG